MQTDGEAKTFDYFLVSERIAHAVAGTFRLDESGIRPHSPVRLILDPDCRHHMSLELVRPPLVPPYLAKGSIDVDPALALEASRPVAATAVALDIAAAAWTDLAHKKWKA